MHPHSPTRVKYSADHRFASLEADAGGETDAHPSGLNTMGALHSMLQAKPQKQTVAHLEGDLLRAKEEIRCLRSSLAAIQDQKVAELERELLQAKREIHVLQAEANSTEISSHSTAAQKFAEGMVKPAVSNACALPKPSHSNDGSTSTQLHLDKKIEASFETMEASHVARNSVRIVLSEAQRRVEMVNEIVWSKRNLLKQIAFATVEQLSRSALAASWLTWKAIVDKSRKCRQSGDILKCAGLAIATRMTNATLGATWVSWKAVVRGNSRVRLCRDTLSSSWTRMESIGCLRLCVVAWRNVTSHGWWAQMCGERADLLSQLQRAKQAASEERQRWAEEHRAHKRTQDQLDQALDNTLQGLSRAEKVSNAREDRISQLVGANGWLQLKVGQLENDLNRSHAREGQALLRLDKVLSSQAAALQSRSPPKSSLPIPEADFKDSTPVYKVQAAPFHEELTRAVERRNAKAANVSSKRSLGGPRRQKPRDDSLALQGSPSKDLHRSVAIESSSNNGKKGGSIRRAASTGDLTSSAALSPLNHVSSTSGHSASLSASCGLDADQGKPMAGALRPRKRPSSAGSSRPLSASSAFESTDIPQEPNASLASDREIQEEADSQSNSAGVLA
eukprot:gnl/MRDRNA2_/MRDRNA2_118853_c0_seq1.p1 gnl/MRDRNA2_/MRDRNA2_118853_c0~~gnl/MRDRNA2_/MRDRNA2_118853_c0_seq1.p1  ORF type:complete len:621 (+),score=103.00 gnl/MRDRNA2_/MRDRNA2_118853_c0_seq1:185-2047(+)